MKPILKVVAVVTMLAWAQFTGYVVQGCSPLSEFQSVSNPKDDAKIEDCLMKEGIDFGFSKDAGGALGVYDGCMKDAGYHK